MYFEYYMCLFSFLAKIFSLLSRFQLQLVWVTPPLDVFKG